MFFVKGHQGVNIIGMSHKKVKRVIFVYKVNFNRRIISIHDSILIEMFNYYGAT